MSKKKTKKYFKQQLFQEESIIFKKSSFAKFIEMTSQISQSKWTKYFLLFMLPAALLIYYPTNGRSSDYDIWWQFALAKHYITNHTLRIDHSIFSWTPSDSGYIYNTCLGSIILYLIYFFTKGFGLWLFQWIIFISIFLLYCYYIKAMKDILDINYILGLLILGIALSLTSLTIKPQLFTVLFFAIVVFIYFYSKISCGDKLFFLYPPLFMLWANLHGGFLAGLVFITIILVGEIISYLLNMKQDISSNKMLLNMGISVLFSYFAILINPYGISYPLFVLKSLYLKDYMGYAGQVVAYENMWNYLLPKDIKFRFTETAWMIMILFLILNILILYAYQKIKYFNITIFIVNIVFFIFSMQAARYTLFSPLISLFSIIFIVQKLDFLSILRAKLNFYSGVIFFIFMLVSSYYSIGRTSSPKWFGFGIDDFLPIKEIDFLIKNKIKGPMFNDYSIGGYMMWEMYPEYKVFIDPRYGPYWKQTGPDYMNFIANPTSESIRKFTSKYNFKVALISANEMGKLIFPFLKTDEWSIIYFDKVAVVIAHRSLISSLSPDVFLTDLGPKRFSELSNPFMLINLFNIYLLYDPNDAMEILNFFEKNVSNLFVEKKACIEELSILIQKKEFELKK